MINTRETLVAHSEVDNHLASLEARSRSARMRTYWANMRVLNDHAYFVLIFGRFEQHVEALCARLISRRAVAALWRRRRLWDALDLDRMPFMQKVSLLMDRGLVEYGRVRTIYVDIRCAIAHGDSAAVGPIVLPTLASELRTLSGLLTAQ